MSTADEPEILVAAASNVTSGTINTNVVSTIIAAPGAGLRIRVFGIDVAPIPDSTGNIRVSAGVAMLAAKAGQGDHVLVPQGIPLADNAALTFTDRSNVATQNYLYAVRYVIEST